ncbi:hypothetical protein ACN3E9_00660 [Vibrio pectenicida]|uniref:hypothetical protein n=1 Tax=Vibrio pectenicida TaxID=62763 RepID=UPI003B9DC470
MLKRVATIVSVVFVGMYNLLPARQTELNLDNQKSPERYEQPIISNRPLPEKSKSLLTKKSPSIDVTTINPPSGERTFSYQESNRALHSFHNQQFSTLSENSKVIINEIPIRYTDEKWAGFYQNLGFKDNVIEQLLTLRAVQIGDLAQESEVYNSYILTVAPHQFLIEILKNKYKLLARQSISLEKNEAIFQVIQEVFSEYGIDISLTETYAKFNFIENNSDTDLRF